MSITISHDCKNSLSINIAKKKLLILSVIFILERKICHYCSIAFYLNEFLDTHIFVLRTQRIYIYRANTNMMIFF